MAHSVLRSALVLGLLSTVGPFSIDMYLPAMPAIGLAQLIYGPWADQAGRKPPISMRAW